MNSIREPLVAYTLNLVEFAVEFISSAISPDPSRATSYLDPPASYDASRGAPTGAASTSHPRPPRASRVPGAARAPRPLHTLPAHFKTLGAAFRRLDSSKLLLPYFSERWQPRFPSHFMHSGNIQS